VWIQRSSSSRYTPWRKITFSPIAVKQGRSIGNLACLAALALLCGRRFLFGTLWIAGQLALRVTFVLAIWTAISLFAMPSRAKLRQKPSLFLYSDCYMFAGSENMPAILVDDPDLNARFDVSLAYRWTRWYQQRLESTVARRKEIFPLRLPVPPHDEMGLYIKRHFAFWPMWLASKLYVFFAYDLIRLYFFFRSHQPDILHVNNGGYPAAESARAAVLAAWLAGTRSIVLHVNSKALPRPATRGSWSSGCSTS